MVLVNCCLLSLYSDTGQERLVKFRNQDDCRLQLVESLLHMSTATPDAEIPRKKSFGHIYAESIQVPVHRHQHIRMEERRDCAACKGVRYSDHPPKRVALAEIAMNKGRESKRKETYWGYKECNVALCQNGDCFRKYHQNH